MRLSLPLAALALGLFLRPAAAIPMPDARIPIPVDRLISNVSKYIQRHPKDASGYYTMARVHSIAFAHSIAQPPPTITIIRGREAVREEQVRGNNPTTILAWPNEAVDKHPERELPDIETYNWYQDDVNRSPSFEELRHLRESVRFYNRAVALAPKEHYYWLGYGWVLEQGIPYAAQLGSPWVAALTKSKKSDPREWTQQALAAYRHAYHGSLAGFKFEYQNGTIIESGEGILRLQATRQNELTPQDIAEAQKIQTVIKKVSSIPVPMSPIILPLGESRSLPSLLARNTSVRFDLAGDGLGRRWPWVTPETGILVWDPRHEGRITSGRQLFGSVTWWVFWKTGYEALAALDNDANGSLSGRELDGIALWRDANSNGVSDPGEVRPLSDYGITALSTQATHQINSVPANLRGATTASGTTLPTYDWTPKSLN